MTLRLFSCACPKPGTRIADGNGLMRVLLVLALMLVALHADANTQMERCDWPAYKNPCKVPGGVYRALAPKGPGPHKTIIYLYGSTGHSKTVTDAAFFQQIVDRFGYALIVPGALDINYRGGSRDTGWTLRNGVQKTRDEIKFLKNVMKDASHRFALDTDNVLFLGQSRGGFLIWEIACHNPELGSAFAVHAGGYLGKLPSRCKRPVKFLQTHGVSDKVVAYNGMEDVSGTVDMPPVPQALKMMERTNGCAPGSDKPTGKAPNFARYTWTGCKPGGALELMLHNGGHDYPANWFQVAIDWFEDVNAGPDLLPLADPSKQGQTIRFTRPQTNSRFKKAPKP
ncbi:hypothetical protein KHP62_15360 [Rhodobacteraceae bacterium NNCM2]|nr:hypothetical protein [Coraliihabitans acroporae]